MNIESLVKLLGVFNKPFHYIIVGIVILLLGSEEWKIWGWLLIAFGISSCLEWLFNFFKKKYESKQEKIKKQNEREVEKQNLYYAYDNLNWDEKIIIFNCVINNSLVYKDQWKSKEEKIIALATKGFGSTHGFDKFILKPNYLNWLKDYPPVEADYNEYW